MEILRGCVPSDLPEPDRLVTDGHHVLIDSIDSQKIIDENYQRDQQLAEVKTLLHQRQVSPETNDLQVDIVVTKPMHRVKWGMHPLGQKLVDDL